MENSPISTFGLGAMSAQDNLISWRQAAQVLTRPVLAQAGRTGHGQFIRKLLSDAGLPVGSGQTVAELLDQVLDGLRRNYRCEYFYKAAIADRVVFGRHSPRTASLHVELPVGRSIIDLAIFNGTSTAYEIKTEFDSHRRLLTQTPDYLRVFERVYLVTHPSISPQYLRVLDDRVGILTLQSNGSLSEIRAPRSSTSNLDKMALFQMLRAQEYVQAARDWFGDQPELPNGRRYEHYRRLWEQLTTEQAHASVVKAMRERTTAEPMVDFVRALPRSCRVLGYATPLSKPQQKRVLNALHDLNYA
ncbi:sce7726 family protein [Xanthomonas campestris]|nr:sce7726 family protein [Xanthomonas campestris]MCF8788329.1 sce7726 family protein [Xanthomonas campestris pv. campestris]MCF8804478.1 sce7726 family protein [Xanthomonas campestris pv. campestris]MCF8863990.1 sce7726 family protein [Xanthomonas campestris pv. campestris]MDM7601741.1 sce7726 family protein [Xanthomonas campestris pv. campestris]MDM7605692.1 sce7726 family protein [Xanthomonas campestris pv. campestris]